jgi:small subunit ribosomal protein S8e
MESLQATKKSSHVLRKLAKRKASLEQGLEEQFSSGRLLAAITSRPGQSGRADGCVPFPCCKCAIA